MWLFVLFYMVTKMKILVVGKGDHSTQLDCVLEANQSFLLEGRMHWQWFLSVLYCTDSQPGTVLPPWAPCGI